MRNGKKKKKRKKEKKKERKGTNWKKGEIIILVKALTGANRLS